MHALLMNCRDATIITERARYTPLTRMERKGYKLHLLLCKHCRRYAQQSELIDACLQQWADRQEHLHQADTLPAEVKRKWEEQIREKLK